MKYLVTGGLGYVGSWLVRHLGACGHEVYVLSRGAQHVNVGSAYTLIQADLLATTAEDLAELLPAGLDGCVHAASYNEMFLPDYARKALEINAYGTRVLLDALAVYTKKYALAAAPMLVYSSTFHVFGQEGGVIDEHTPAAPRNDYALTHYFAEEYCRMHARTHNQPYAIVRLTNGYGAPITSPFGKWYLLLNDLCKAAFLHKKVVVRANPNTVRNFVWMGDIVTCMEKLLQRADVTGQLFCVASEVSLSIGEIARLVAATAHKVFGYEVLVEFETQPSEVMPLIVKTGHITSTLGVHFSDMLEQEITSICQFLQEHGPA